MSFVRSGPKMLIIEPHDMMQFKKYMKQCFRCESFTDSLNSFEDVLSETDRNQTIIYLSDDAKDNISTFDHDRCLVVNEGAQNILMALVNQNVIAMVKHVRKAPRIVVMKIIGKPEDTVNAVAEDYGVEVRPILQVLNERAKGTIIVFTAASLNKKVQFNELYDQAIYTDLYFSDVIKALDTQSLKYMNRAIGKNNWYELTIKIFDSYDAYKFQYDRLVYVLEKLDAGLILKEGWGEDAAKIFLIVGVYEVTLFTYLEPKEVKKILLALEYMDNGERIVDYDLFYKRKKLHWDDVRQKDIKMKTQLSAYYRKQLYSKLDKESILTLQSMEDIIFASR